MSELPNIKASNPVIVPATGPVTYDEFDVVRLRGVGDVDPATGRKYFNMSVTLRPSRTLPDGRVEHAPRPVDVVVNLDDILTLAQTNDQARLWVGLSLQLAEEAGKAQGLL